MTETGGNSVLQQTNQIPEIIVSQQTANSPMLLAGSSNNERHNDSDLRRSHARSYDEYDSDDELRREDISFTHSSFIDG